VHIRAYPPDNSSNLNKEGDWRIHPRKFILSTALSPPSNACVIGLCRTGRRQHPTVTPAAFRASIRSQNAESPDQELEDGVHRSTSDPTPYWTSTSSPDTRGARLGARALNAASRALPLSLMQQNLHREIVESARRYDGPACCTMTAIGGPGLLARRG
jgi:hypothetical protein